MEPTRVHLPRRQSVPQSTLVGTSTEIDPRVDLSGSTEVSMYTTQTPTLTLSTRDRTEERDVQKVDRTSQKKCIVDRGFFTSSSTVRVRVFRSSSGSDVRQPGSFSVPVRSTFLSFYLVQKPTPVGRCSYPSLTTLLHNHWQKLSWVVFIINILDPKSQVSFDELILKNLLQSR